MVRSAARWAASSVSALALAALLVGCSTEGTPSSDPPASGPAPEPLPSRTSESSSSGDGLDGRTYTATSVTGRELLDGTVLLISFKDGTMTASAGCAKIVGPYSLTDSALAWSSPPETTTTDCGPAQGRQDRWLQSLLTDGVETEVDEDTLSLSAGGVVVELTGSEINRTDQALGRTWRLIGTLEDGATVRLPRGVTRPSLTVRADGLTRITTGCNTGRTRIRVDDGQFVFGPVTTTRQACPGAAGFVEAALLDLLRSGGTDQAEVRDRILLVAREGRGLVFELDRGTVGS